MWATNDLEVLQSASPDLENDEVISENDMLSDGFDGQVYLMTVDLWGCYKKVIEEEASDTVPEEEPAELPSFNIRRNLV